MQRLATLILLALPMAANARGGHCYSSGCYSAKKQFFWFALIVGGCYVGYKTLAWILGAIDRQRRCPGWLADLLIACKRLFTNL